MNRKRYDKQYKLAAARVILKGEMSVKQLSEDLDIKGTTLRRWANEYDKHGDSAFPGNGSPMLNNDYEIIKLKKQVEELEMENKLLKKFRAFLKQDHA